MDNLFDFTEIKKMLVKAGSGQKKELSKNLKRVAAIKLLRIGIKASLRALPRDLYDKYFLNSENFWNYIPQTIGLGLQQFTSFTDDIDDLIAEAAEEIGQSTSDLNRQYRDEAAIIHTPEDIDKAKNIIKIFIKIGGNTEQFFKDFNEMLETTAVEDKALVIEMLTSLDEAQTKAFMALPLDERKKFFHHFYEERKRIQALKVQTNHSKKIKDEVKKIASKIDDNFGDESFFGMVLDTISSTN